MFSVVVSEAFSVVWEVSDWELPAGWEESSVMAVWESLFPDAWELSLVSLGACKDTSLVFAAPGPLFESFLNAKAVVACPAMSAEASCHCQIFKTFVHNKNLLRLVTCYCLYNNNHTSTNLS